MADVVGAPWYGTTFVAVPEAELLAKLVGAHRTVTVLGPGGAGKTRLVTEVLPAVSVGYDRCGFVDVPTASGAADLASLVAERLGARVRQSDPIDAIESTLDGARTLLVLDSCEALVTDAAALVRALISRIPQLDVLCTSRQPLGFDSEVHLRLGPLRERSAELFIDRASLVDPMFDSTATELIQRVCDAADGLPLAIELAAAQLDHRSMAEIAKQIAGRVHLLERESSTGTPRHRSMGACVEWSLDLLTDDERHALRLLSVFEGSFDVVAARTLLDSDEPAAGRLTARLVSRSLLVADRERCRYRLLDSVREVVADERRSSGVQLKASRRHLRWAVERCRTAAAELEGSGLEECVRGLLADDADVAAGFQRAIGDGDLDRAEVMYGSLALHWITSGRFSQAESWFDACGVAADGRALQPRTYWAAALVAVYSGRAQSVDLATRALDLARDVGDELVAARALDVLGFATMPFDPTAAEALLIDAAAGAAAAGDAWCHADASQIAGYASLARGRPEDASAHLLRARPIAERLRHPQLLAWDRAGFALVDAMNGHFRRAAAGLADALDHAATTGDPNITASVTAFRSHVAACLDDSAAWVAPVDDLLHRCLRLGAGQGAAELVIARMELAITLDDLDTANHLWTQSAGPIGTASPTVHRRLAHVGAAAALAAGDQNEARSRLHTTSSRRPPHNDALTDTWLAVVELCAGNDAAARRHLRRAADDNVMASATVDRHDLALAWAALIAGDGNATLATQVIELAGGSIVGDASEPSLIARAIAPRLRHAVSSGRVDHVDPLGAISLARSRGARSSNRFGWTAVTPAELKVAALAAQGLTNRAIASRLGCSAGTVKSHLEHIYAKTGIANRTELAAEHDHFDRTATR